MTKSIQLTLKYFPLVVLLSLPFYVLAAFIGVTKNPLVKLPISILAVFCPLFALLLSDKASFKENFSNVFDLKKINNPVWTLVTILKPTEYAKLVDTKQSLKIVPHFIPYQ
jgi:predicted neutral ceramidase superfamily lipid hydrolase